MIRKLLVLVTVISVAAGCFAEFRIWRDLKGNSIEAEFVCENAGKIVMKDQNGKTYKLEAAKLSAADQKYLKTAIPPQVEITFKKNQDRRNHDYGYSAHVFMNGTIDITKKSRMPYDGELTAVLMMIGERAQTKEFIMLDNTEASFDFKNKKKEFKLDGIRFQMYEAKYDSNYGTEYTGFLAVVLDRNGNLIELKSSRKEFEASYQKIMKFKTGERFKKDFTAKDVVRSY